MIKAELSYNPYLNEINVKFNGQPPRINSLVEKYSGRPLGDWLEELPQIFHDEMNGYGFELDFYGTELDFAEVESAFRRAEVSEREVPVVLKNDMECHEVKVERIRDLLEWLDKNRFAGFDHDSFRADNHELFDTDFVGLIIHGAPQRISLKDVSLENVHDARELENTDLTHTPILYCISADILPLVQKDMSILRRRRDVSDRQIFFSIDSTLDRAEIGRMLVDIGIAEPNIVSGINDEAVKKYFLIYPFSDYVYSAIRVFRKVTDKLKADLDKVTDSSRVRSSAVHEQLKEIDEKIRLIKETDEKLLHREKLDFPAGFTELKDELIGKLSKWESRKTKITDRHEAHSAAVDYYNALKRYFSEFISKLEQTMGDQIRNIRDDTLSLYRSAKTEDEFYDSVVPNTGDPVPMIADQIFALLNIKEKKYVVYKGNLFEQIFGTENKNGQNKPVLQTTYYYQSWREYMVNLVDPIVEKIISDRYELLDRYSQNIANAYHEHLKNLLERRNANRAYAVSSLSEEELALQKDNDWLDRFIEKLESIERS